MASAVIGALRVNLSADTAEFKRNLSDAEKAAEKFGRTIGSGLRTGLLALTGAASAGAVALVALTKSSFDNISAQVDLARRVGASVAAIQTLQHAAELSGSSNEALAKTLGMLNVKLGEAAQKGAGPAYEAIQRLGLSIKDLAAADADVRIKMISDAMAELGMTTQQEAATLRALGVKQQEVINLFQEGSQAIDDSRAELKAWGVLLSDTDAAKVEQTGDALDKMKTILQGIGNQIAIRIAPSLEAFVNKLGDLAKNGNIVDMAFTKLNELFRSFNEEVIRDGATISVFLRKLQLAEEVISSFRIGKEGGVDWAAFTQAHASAASDIAKIWQDMDTKLQNLKGPDALLKGLDEYLNKSNKLVQGVDSYIAKIQKVTGGDDSGESDQQKKMAAKAAKAQETYQQQLDTKLASLQESLLSERDAEIASYDDRMLALEDFHNRQMLTDQEFRDLAIKSEADHAAKLKDIDDEVAENNLRNAQKQADGWFGIADSIGNSLNSIFGESKAVAIAQAIINTAQAITKSLAEYGATPLGLAAAAAAAVAGAAQIATITKTTKSSKSGGGGANFATPSAASSSAGNSNSSSSPALSQTLFVHGITAGSLFSGEAVRELAQKLIDYQSDGGKIVLGQT